MGSRVGLGGVTECMPEVETGTRSKPVLPSYPGSETPEPQPMTVIATKPAKEHFPIFMTASLIGFAVIESDIPHFSKPPPHAFEVVGQPIHNPNSSA